MPIPVLLPLDARIPEWVDRPTERPCPFCKTDNESILTRPDRLPVAFCKLCQCWYVNRIPPVFDIEKQYDGYYRIHRPTDLSAKSVSRMIENASIESEKDWQLHVLAELLGGIKGKRIMDVGCGWGRFLLMARSIGAEVAGCDLSPEACEFAGVKLGIPVFHSNLISCQPSIGKMDAVVMRDFIEHPIEPWLDLQAAANVLKPGGLLLIHTPNGGEAGMDLESAMKWVGFRVDLEHLQYLSSHTMNILAPKLGMWIERLEAFGFPGLIGIDELPESVNRYSKAWRSLKETMKDVRGIRKSVRVIRAMKAEISDKHPIDSRLGSYHLFIVLRKPDDSVGSKP